MSVSASSAPSASSMRANSMLSSSQKPPRTPSAMLSLAVTATSATDRVAHGLHDRAREPGPVLEAAAVLVGALVQPRREERAQQIAVTEVDLDRVEARVAQHARAVGELLGDASRCRRRSRPACAACRAG